MKAPNGAITNMKLLDRAGDVSWLKPTIENPTKGVWGAGLQDHSYLEVERRKYIGLAEELADKRSPALRGTEKELL